MAGGVDDQRPSGDFEDVFAAYFSVDAAPRRWRKTGSDLGVQLSPLLGRVPRRWSRALAADERRVLGVGYYLDVAPVGDLSGAAGVVVVEVGEHDPVDVRGGKAQLNQVGAKIWTPSDCAGIDERGAVFVSPEIDLSTARGQ